MLVIVYMIVMQNLNITLFLIKDNFEKSLFFMIEKNRHNSLFSPMLAIKSHSWYDKT